jgi:hypothetical protein
LNFVPKTDCFFWFLTKLVRTGFQRHIDIVIPKGLVVDWMRESGEEESRKRAIGEDKSIYKRLP